MSNGLKAIEDIRKVFELLVKKNKNLLEEAENLNKKVQDLEGDLQAKSDEINDLNEKYNVLKMTKKLKGSEVENSKEQKLKINEMIKEIDKCIALLNK